MQGWRTSRFSGAGFIPGGLGVKAGGTAAAPALSAAVYAALCLPMQAKAVLDSDYDVTSINIK